MRAAASNNAAPTTWPSQKSGQNHAASQGRQQGGVPPSIQRKTNADAPIQRRSWLDDVIDGVGGFIGDGVDMLIDGGTALVSGAADALSETAGSVVGIFNEDLGEDIKAAGDSISDGIRSAGDSLGDIAGDFTHGFISGASIENPNLAQIAGMTTASFVPVVGQIADARDVATGLMSGETDRMLESMAGIIPGGEVLKHADKAMAVISHVDEAAAVISHVDEMAAIVNHSDEMAAVVNHTDEMAAVVNRADNVADATGTATRRTADVAGATSSQATRGLSTSSTTGTTGVTSARTRQSPLNAQQQIDYEAARARGLTAAESYRISTGKNPLNQVGSDYMAGRETNKIMDYYQQSATRNYNNNLNIQGSAARGTRTHTDVANDMRTYWQNNQGDLPYISNVDIEQNFLNQQRINNNARGSSRIDIAISNNANNNVHVADLKTGSSRNRYRAGQQGRNELNFGGRGNPNGYNFSHQEIRP